MGIKKVNIRIGVIVICCLFLGANMLMAANEITNILKNTYGGFSKNWAIDFDEKGIAYIGNEAGLLRFDGNLWELYSTPGKGSIRSVFVAGKRIYTGSFEEFGFWENNGRGQLRYTSLSIELSQEILHNDMIWKIIPGHQGEVIFQAFNTLYIYKNNALEVKEIGSGIIFLTKVRDRIITQKTRGNIIEYADGDFKEVAESDALNRAYTRVFLPFGSDKFLLGSGKKGLFIWDGHYELKEWQCDAQELIRNFNINTGAYDGRHYYIGTLDNGVFKINSNGQVIEHLHASNGLESNTILDLKCDRQKRLWIALNKGISCVEFNRPVHYITDQKADWGVVHTAAIYQNRLYVGTNQGVYYHAIDKLDLSDLKPSDFKTIEELKGQVWTLKTVSNSLLCSHSRGTFQIQGNDIKQLSDIGGGQNFVPLRLKDQDYLIQNSHTSLVLFDQNNKGVKLASILKGFFEPSRNMEVDQNNNIWVSHTRRKEVFKVKITDVDKPLIKERYGLNKGMPQNAGNKVSKLDGRIIFTTNDGLFTYDELRDTVVRYSKIEEQINEYANANAVTKSGFNAYWFALPQKVALFEMTSGTLNKVFEFAFSNPYNSLDEKYPVIVSLNDSTTAFGLENGLALVYQSAYKNRKESNDKIVLKHVAYRDKDNVTRRLSSDSDTTVSVIPYANKRIVFEYMSMASIAHKGEYWLMLEGFHKRWIKGNLQNRIAFENLSWGDYTLHIKGEDEFGHALLPLSYAFTIPKPFFLKSWFIILAVSFAIVLLAGIIFLGKKLLNKHHNKLIEDEKKAWDEKYEEEQKQQEERMIRLKNELLQKEIQHQSTELANRTIATIKRKEVLTEVKEEILKQREHLKYSYPEKYMNRLIRMIDHSIEDEDDWNVFRMHFDRAHEDFFKRIKNTYDDLTPKDLRLCAYLKMNLSTKEIAPLMNVSTRSVEVHRYKIRKKLGLDPNDNLTEFMISF
ncbi:LuxR C-terminal-related transcriptional regulator [Carboxylicivirga sp. RSCT41]|uniref:helix-turn-helix and ligand-binding sensor domain-containing protein n=1 Tax=Carboxylicivirga agarovorans TaxID=3417570 RepID=UPI003D33E042